MHPNDYGKSPLGLPAPTCWLDSYREEAMFADINLHVWLETDPSAHPGMIIPYVQTVETVTLQYQLLAVREGQSGTSRIGQSGTVNVPASKPTPLSMLSLGNSQNDNCQILLTLAEGGMQVGKYHFECPK